MSNVNRIILIANLGRDPELKHTPKGNAYCNLSIATHKTIIDKETGEKRKETQWHRATIWGKQAETTAKFLTKGSRVYIEGELRLKDWKDKEGNPRRTPEIHVDSIQFLGGGTPKAGHMTGPELAPVMVQ